MKRTGFGGMLAFMTVCIVLACMGSAFAWGPDIPIWTGGKVNCFDADYGMDGNMYVAFQAQGQPYIEIYRSTDHGFSWNEFKSLPLSGVNSNALGRIKLVFDESTAMLHVFHVNTAGYLVHWTVSTIFTPFPSPAVISDAPIVQDSFDAAWNLKSGSSGRISASWSLGTAAGDRHVIRTFNTSSSIWTTAVDDTWLKGANARKSIAFGPPNNFYEATSAYPMSMSSYEIGVKKSSDGGATWNAPPVITSNSYNDYDPRVAAANSDNSGVWTLYNKDKGSHEIDLYFKYSPNGTSSWNSTEYVVSAVAGVDEYIADVKFYKGTGNTYVDMVYIYDDPSGSPVRKAYFVWSSTADPTHWSGKTLVNDQDITSWPENVAPRLVYSPNAPASGAGVVFSYGAKTGLYFDAPWVQAAQTLTVTVQGSGSVASSPAGINCNHPSYSGSAICSASFAGGTTVVLTATPINGADYTTSFYQWEGACSGTGPCVVSMTAARSVKATFVSLAEPVYALPVPTTTNTYSYLPVETPVEDPSKGSCKPLAVGNVAGGVLNLNIGLHQYAGPVDIYVALMVPDLSSEIFLIDESRNILPLSAGVVPFRTNVVTAFSESIFGDIPTSLLPKSDYIVGLYVTPAGNPGLGDLWVTSFTIY